MARMDHVARTLSSLARTGWMLRGVPPQIAETVAAHSFTAALISLDLSLALARRGFRVDPYRATVIALVHDLAESVIGDIARTRIRGLEEVKERAELEAFDSLAPEEVIALFREYEEKSTVEAIIARISDQLATLSKGEEYKSIGFNSVDDIIESCRKAVEKLIEKAGSPIGEAIREIVEDHYGIKLGR
ncbi:MAG: HD family hydrolase [Desulfurococcales archaeon]|nr:HD family hydrolase [Desulfurococcales archaeon]